MSRHALLFVIIVTALLSLVTQTQVGAVAVPIASRAELGANDLVDWGALGAKGTVVPYPFNYQSANGFQIRVTKEAANPFVRLDQCAPNRPPDCFTTPGGWAGNFLQGDKLLFTAGALPGEGPITIEFSRPILGAGVQIQPNHSGGCEYAAQLRAFDAAGNLLVSFSRGGCSSAAADGSALFLGVRDATATIKRIELVPLPVPQFAGFAINRLSLVLPPVVLVHGICGQPDSFGKMSNLLAKAGLSVTTFDYSSFSNGLPTDVRIEELAGFFADHVNDVRTRTGASQVDVVAHSMGGLIARAWMAGLATVHVPYLGQIRKLVLAGTPNYGINGTLALVRRLAPLGIGCSSTQNDQITHGGIHTESKPETSCS